MKTREAGGDSMSLCWSHREGKKPDRSSSWLLDYERLMSDTTSECYTVPSLMDILYWEPPRPHFLDR